MPITTNLNGSPYFDDYSESSDYHMVLFKPNVSVQVRELNVLQSMVQQQIEKFGDNIFDQGAIVEGVNINFNSSLPYVKINDLTISGTSATPNSYLGMQVTNSKGLSATIIATLNGYQSTDPNLNTLYLKYINSGYNYMQSTYSSGDILTITNKSSSLFSININNGGANFTNSDSVIFVPALSVSVTTNVTFQVAETIVDGNNAARATILEVNTTAIATKTVLKIAPLQSDLSNTSQNSAIWTFYQGDSILGNSSGAAATISSIIGSGAVASSITDGSGRIISVPVTVGGQGYTIPPYCTIKPTQSSSDLTDLNLTALNYLANVTVSSTANAVGTGYQAFVTEGTLYKKGFFIRVAPQSIIVSPYTNQPNNLSLVFQTNENIINSNEDQSLLDIVTGSGNINAPGADRLQLTANLLVVNTSSISNSTLYLPIASFSEGQIYQIQTNTQYASIETEMAQRTFDSSGNFVLDQFQVTTKSTLNQTYEGNTVTYVIDPGTAYISGYKVQTVSNYTVDVPKGIVTNTSPITVGLNYDTYIRVDELGGLFQFNTGDKITFYDTAKAFITNTVSATTGNTTPVGNTLGTARIRSMLLESGNPGTNTAVYRMYLFDISMNTGTNFKNIKSIYYNNILTGIGDVVLELDPTTQVNNAILHGNTSTLVFETQTTTVQSVNNVIYTYRTVNNSVVLSNNGVATISLSGNSSQYFPYLGNLNFDQLTDFYIVPVSNSVYNSNTITNSNTVVTSSNTTLTGTNTTFITDLAPGDYIQILNNTTANSNIKKIISITNSTFLTVDSNISFSSSNVSVSRYFPKNVPVPFGVRTGLTANVDNTQKILTINFGFQLAGVSSANLVVAYNVQRENAQPGTKSVSRNNYVKIFPANNVNGLNGPWCLGVPEAIRLNHVYLGTNSSVNTSMTDIVSYFYINNNENPDYSDLSYLYLNPKASYEPDANTYLLVCFDALTITSTGYYTTQSYIPVSNGFITDSLPVANLGSNVSIWEIPEFYDNNDNYYDLTTCFDFRPVVNATATLTQSYSSANINPIEQVSFGNTTNIVNDLMFPLPISTLTSNVTYYQGRNDTVVMGIDGFVQVIQGNYGSNAVPIQPNDTLLINNINIPAYPTLEQNPSSNVNAVLNTRMSSGISTRINNHAISTLLTAQQINIDQPSGYSMSDIAALEARILALEYETSLNSLETSVQQQVIPSSIDPSLDRFKYGFFADSFTTYDFIDTSDPEYTASILNNEAVPHLENINIVHDIGSSATAAYKEFTVVSQDNATYNEDAGANSIYGLPASCNLFTNVTIYDAISFQLQPTKGDEYDVTSFEVASSGGNCTLYFYFAAPTSVVALQGDYSSTSGDGPFGPTAFDGQPVLIPQTLNSNDITLVASDPVFSGINYTSGFSTTVYSNNYSITNQDTGIYTQGIGKFTFNMNPGTENSYSILTHNYEYSSTETVANTVTVATQVQGPTQYVYAGYEWVLNIDQAYYLGTEVQDLPPDQVSSNIYQIDGLGPEVLSTVSGNTVYYGHVGGYGGTYYVLVSSNPTYTTVYTTQTTYTQVTTLNYSPSICKYKLLYPINSNTYVDCYALSSSVSNNAISNTIYVTQNTNILGVSLNGLSIIYNAAIGVYQIAGNVTINTFVSSTDTQTNQTLIWDTETSGGSATYPVYQSTVVVSSTS